MILSINTPSDVKFSRTSPSIHQSLKGVKVQLRKPSKSVTECHHIMNGAIISSSMKGQRSSVTTNSSKIPQTIKYMTFYRHMRHECNKLQIDSTRFHCLGLIWGQSVKPDCSQDNLLIITIVTIYQGKLLFGQYINRGRLRGKNNSDMHISTAQCHTTTHTTNAILYFSNVLPHPHWDGSVHEKWRWRAYGRCPQCGESSCFTCCFLIEFMFPGILKHSAASASYFYTFEHHLSFFLILRSSWATRIFVQISPLGNRWAQV